MKSIRQCHFFVVGCLVGSVLVLIPSLFLNRELFKQTKISPEKMKEFMRLHQTVNLIPLYDETLSQMLFEEVKILCMVMTHPANHQKKAAHILETWGKRCNKLIFMSSQEDIKLGAVALPFADSRSLLWNKTKAAFQYAYDKHINDFDWFLKADDDNYIIVENVRYMLAQYNPNTAFYFGHRYAMRQIDEGYMAGGGYVLSKKALKKFTEKLVHNKTQCQTNYGSEDYGMGECLAHHAIFVDCRDELHQKRFFPVGVEEHMRKKVDPKYWYTERVYYNITQGNIDCCSETSAEYHYINPREIRVLDYYIYKVHPFGIDDHLTEVLPQKLSLKEIIEASDANSSAPLFKKHQDNHYMDPDEFY